MNLSEQKSEGKMDETQEETKQQPSPPPSSSPSGANATANHSNSRKRRPMQGHYADPLSPIASTPMKRQRIKTAENTKSTKPKHAPTGTASKTPQHGGNADFFSPRKLADEYDDADGDDGKSDGKKSHEKAGNSHTATPAREGEDVEHHINNPTADATDEMFSPALKPPRNASRSASSSPSSVRVRLDDNFLSSSSTISSTSTSEKAIEETVTVTYEESIASNASSDVSIDQEFNPFYFMKTLPKYEDIIDGTRPVVLPERSRNTPNICLVLDLDETLVHCSVDEVENPHLQFSVNFNGVDYTVNVKKRPHMEYFLKRVSAIFEVVVFTASHRAYAEKLLNLIDPHRQLIKYRLYREDCLDVYGNYLKDLNVLGRNLSKVLLVDNSPHAFGYQVNNGIPIETWYEDEADDELLNLLPFLESLVDVDDVRPIVEKQFQIQKLIDATPDDIS